MDRPERGNTPVATRATPTSEGDRPQSTSSNAPEQPASPIRRRPRQPSIRIQRLPSFDRHSLGENSSGIQGNLQQLPQLQIPSRSGPSQSIISQTIRDEPTLGQLSNDDETWQANRRRSSSEPNRGRFTSPPSIQQAESKAQPMSPVKEETASQFRPSMDLNALERPFPYGPSEPSVSQGLAPSSHPVQRDRRPSIFRRVSRARANTAAAAIPTDQPDLARDEYESHIVDLLDVVDPQVSTLSTLTNVQNSLFVPDLGGLLNRKPTYTLSRQPHTPDSELSDGVDLQRLSLDVRKQASGDSAPLFRQDSIRSVLGDAAFAILPDGTTLEGWTIADVEELNDHVRHMLHSRRSKFKRTMKGFLQYIKKPLGFFVFLYATLITLFGLAWVLFLIGWVNVGGKQSYLINVIDNVLVALFAIMGDGLAPFRAVDTYHMIYIAHYHNLTWKLRKKRALPKLHNKNDLPSRSPPMQIDLERNGTGSQDGIVAAATVDDETILKKYEGLNGGGDNIETQNDQENQINDEFEFSVLTAAQQRKLDHHSQKFSKSHTFYKPHETATHYAFPLRLLIVIVVLLDFHSIFQIALGTCTWSINYHVRPFALTTVILCCSLACNITAGILISVGDHRTRKTEVVKRMFRQKLTKAAIKKMGKRRKREEHQNDEVELEQQQTHATTATTATTETEAETAAKVA